MGYLRRTTASRSGRRRWLWLTGVVALVLLAWIASWALERRELLRRRMFLEQVGATITLRPGSPSWVAKAIGPGLTEEVIAVGLVNKHCDDSVLAQVDRFAKLERLLLYHTSVTDEGLQHLRELHELRLLSLTNCEIDGPGLRYLADLPALEELRMDAIDDQALEYVRGLSNLRVLTLMLCERVTDRGVMKLVRLPRLEQLTLLATGVTAEGVERLQQAMPGLKIAYSGRLTGAP